MSFNTFTYGTKTYEPRSEGVYTSSSVKFGDPDDSIVIRPANPRSQVLRFGVSSILQKDVTVNGETERKTATVTVSIVAPSSGFTDAELSDLVSRCESVLTPANVTRIGFGEA